MGSRKGKDKAKGVGTETSLRVMLVETSQIRSLVEALQAFKASSLGLTGKSRVHRQTRPALRSRSRRARVVRKERHRVPTKEQEGTSSRATSPGILQTSWPPNPVLVRVAAPTLLEILRINSHQMDKANYHPSLEHRKMVATFKRFK